MIAVFSSGFWILILSRIPDSLSCILDSKAKDSGFHKEKFHGLQNPDSPTRGDLIINGDNALVLCYIIKNTFFDLQLFFREQFILRSGCRNCVWYVNLHLFALFDEELEVTSRLNCIWAT